VKPLDYRHPEIMRMSKQIMIRRKRYISRLTLIQHILPDNYRKIPGSRITLDQLVFWEYEPHE